LPSSGTANKSPIMTGVDTNVTALRASAATVKSSIAWSPRVISATAPVSAFTFTKFVRPFFSTMSKTESPSGDQCRVAPWPPRGAALSPPTVLPISKS
jgi:hypothetical protein